MLTLNKCFRFSFLFLQLFILFNSFNEILSINDVYEERACKWKGMSGKCTLIENCPTLNNYINNYGNLTDIQACSRNHTKVTVCCIDHPVLNLLRMKRSPRPQERKKPRIPFVFEDDPRLQNPPRRTNTNIYPTINSNTRTPIINYPTIPTPRTNSVNVPTQRPLSKRPAEIACDEFRKLYPASVNLLIVGDKVQAQPGEFPHVVAIGYNSNPYEFRCGGTLISESFVLTAAHCASSTESQPRIVRMGRINIKEDIIEDSNGIDVNVKRVIVHRSYRARNVYHDIALLELFRPVKFEGSRHPACLYTNLQDLSANEQLVISGWGIENVNVKKSVHVLQKSYVKTVPLNNCKSFTQFRTATGVPNGIIDTQLCAFNETSDTCEGDSGGPLQINDGRKVPTVIGITSFGLSCLTNTPGIYTRVASYLDWIESNVWPHLIN